MLLLWAVSKMPDTSYGHGIKLLNKIHRVVRRAPAFFFVIRTTGNTPGFCLGARVKSVEII